MPSPSPKSKQLNNQQYSLQLKEMPIVALLRLFTIGKGNLLDRIKLDIFFQCAIPIP